MNKGSLMDNKDRFVNLLKNKLIENKESIQDQWRHPQGTHTKHFVIDNLLPEEWCKRIYSAFPRDGSGFFNRETFREKKRTSADLKAYDPILAEVTYAFQDEVIVSAISDLVGFAKIEPDPMLYAGGLSMMFQGDFLNPHIDNSHDVSRQRYRRLNLLYYVSPDWTLERGGNFELWDESRTAQKTLISRFNRLVVMETNKSSWHSVSPVKATHPRCCVSNYYFSAIAPDSLVSADYFHVTSFTGRPEEKFRRVVGVFDNAIRNLVSSTLKIGRGRNLINKSKE
jgi:Rps23 Pro-64 3,4-dihydroxylase Tpa1-like proline 4-hydroxylase